MKNLLVVDDSFTVRKVLEMLLVPLGYKLTFAENGKQALDFVKSNAFELVILDNGLPDIDGVSLSKELKKIKPSMSLILMKNAKEEIEETTLKECRIDDVLTKPFDSQTLISKIDAVSTKAEEVIEKPILTEEKQTIEDSFKFDLSFGEEFAFESHRGTEEKKEIVTEEIEELSDLELIEEIEEAPKKEEKFEEEISLEELLEEGEIKIEEEKPLIEPVEEEETKVNIDDLFSDLNDILTEKEEQPKLSEREPILRAKDVKPVVEEVAKDLKELETITEKSEAEELKIEDIEELDIWDFTPEEEKQPVTETKLTETTIPTINEPFDVDRKSIERLVREMTYEVVEKVAWEVVPEIVDTILKDKFGKK